MVFIRKGLDYVFTQTELKWLDDIMPEISKREKDDEDIKKLETKEDVSFHLKIDLSFLLSFLTSSITFKGIYVDFEQDFWSGGIKM